MKVITSFAATLVSALGLNLSAELTTEATSQAQMMGERTIVIDIGAPTISAGFAGDNVPTVSFPAICGYPEKEFDNMQDAYYGTQALRMSGVLQIVNAVEGGQVSDWGCFSELLWYTFRNELRVDVSEHSVMVNMSTGTPKSIKEKLVTTFFDTFAVREMYILDRAVASTYSAGRTTALVLDVDDDVSTAVPVFEGSLDLKAVRESPVGGYAVTDSLLDNLAEAHEAFEDVSEPMYEYFRQMTDSVCYVAIGGLEKEFATFDGGVDFQLPDGEKLKLGEEVFVAPEVLFDPQMAGLKGVGLHKLVSDVIDSVELDMRHQLSQNVILAGHSSRLDGIGARIEYELRKYLPSGAGFRVISSVDRVYSAWLGASTLSSLSTFESQWLTREMYEEVGVDILDRLTF